ncbi:NACHT domain-containing protein [Streptomyces sp. NPDC058249]|uniref:NACHT domain-containing protein n=1 Tax=Streptomyces sp. NPDC058249 TaxID=3346403 RepID=UPI0036E5F188
MTSRHRFVDLKGLATRGDYAPALKDVFVDVSLGARPAHEVRHEALAGAVRIPEPSSRRRSIWDFLGGPQGACVAVVGAPGTGKTTLLKHVALSLSQGQRSKRPVPVMLLLRDHAAAITADPSLTLDQVISSSLRRLQVEEPAGWFAQQLQDGRCVVLLDGLDEVASETDRRAVSRWVEEQVEQYEANDFILTSRPHGYLRAPLNRAQVLHVRRFTGEQISQFVLGWYQAVEKLSTGTDDAGVAQQATEEAQDLLSRLRSRPTLYELATNPLLLTMIAHVHRYRGALPGSRAGLYSEICEVLLWRRDQVKHPLGPDLDITGAKKEVVLRELAYQMMAGRRRDVDVEHAGRLLQPVLSRVSVAVPTDSVEAFLDSMAASGLLVERELGVWAFAHFTLQEHLAAQHIRQHQLTDVLTTGVNDDWWRETTLLYAAHADPSTIIEACLDSRATQALALAFDCADTAAELAPETARRLEDLRRRALQESTHSSTRWLMAAVTATRLLGESLRLGNDTMLCARPISREVYQLFTEDTGRCVGSPLLQSSADAAAVGIPQQDVAPFLQWLNGLLQGAATYRLPTANETADPAFALVSLLPHHTVWRAADEDGPASDCQLWVPDTAKHPYEARLPDPSHWPDQLSRTVLSLGQLGLAHAFVNLLERLAGTPLAEPLGVSPRQVRALNSRLRRLLETTVVVEDAIITVLEETRKLAHTLISTNVQEQARRQAASLPLDNALALQQTFTLASGVLGDATGGDLARAVDATLSDQDRHLRNAVYVRACVHTLTKSRRSARQALPADSSSQVAIRFLRACLPAGYGARIVLPADLAATLERASAAMLERLRAVQAEGAESPRLTLSLAKSARALAASLPDICRFADRAGAAHLQVATLTLAAAAQQTLNQPDIAALYRTGAAGLSILIERADGRAAPSETLVLARS